MSVPDFGSAFAALDAFVAAQCEAEHTPGLALALTDRERTLRVATYGRRDLAADLPVVPETLFEIGSIGKCFTADALLILAERGAVDLEAPVARYLPWFAVPSRFAPIRLRDLLTHTGGIVAGPDGSPSGAGEVWLLRETEAASPPGARFHYSNVGYKALGLVVAEVAGTTYPEAIRELLLRPLGMDATEPAITNEGRARLAVGYAGLHDDRPFHPRHPLMPATWLETDTGDGCLACPPADLAAYARLLLNGGRGPAGPVLTEESYARKVTGLAESAAGAGYGLGIMVRQVDGGAVLGHTGGMVGYSADLRVDVGSGFGAVVFVNGPGDPWTVAHYALALLGAAGRDQELPPPPVAQPADPSLAGSFRRVEGEGPDELHVEPAPAVDGGLLVRFDDDQAPLDPLWDEMYLVDHPTFASHRLVFERDDAGGVTALTHGGATYLPAGTVAPEPAAILVAWHAYPGRYRSHNPWCPFFAVVPRRGRLHLVFPGAPDGFEDDQPLVPLAEAGHFRAGDDPEGPERIHFDAVVEGRALRATLSGCPYWRVD